MKSSNSLYSVLSGLLANLPRRRRMQLKLLLILMVVGALAELISIGAVVPFLAILANPAQTIEQPGLVRLIAHFGWSDVRVIRWNLTFLFVTAALVSGGSRLVLLYAVAKFNFGMAHDLCSEVHRRTLYQPYSVHLARNSSEVIGSISKVDAVAGVVYGLLTGISATLMGIFIIVALIVIDPWMAVLSLVGFGSIYVVVSLLTRKRLADNSRVNSTAFGARVQALQEGLGGIRDVLLDHTQSVFISRFDNIDRKYRRSQASTYFIGPSPRFVVETMGMVLIAALAFTLADKQGGIGFAIPVLGALALGAQRLMPLLQQAYQGWVIVIGHQHVLRDVLDMVRQPLPPVFNHITKALPFEYEIRFQNVTFRYQQNLAPVLSDVDLTIPKGAHVGIVGQTGSGKSTLMDLLMGLSVPSSGQIFVDGQQLDDITLVAWQKNIAHVPQDIFLSDASFAENIAFGVPEDVIDHVRVQQAAEKAQIAAFIASTQYGFKTLVGERGARLSGGQRQRIGIARAFYKGAKVLIFDEATSALDNETEETVMNAIRKLGTDLTVIMIAHRVSTLSQCNLVLRIDNGSLEMLGSYRDLQLSSNDSSSCVMPEALI
jgi:ATP-binding cassette, subfamily B, bacterial PglK